MPRAAALLPAPSESGAGGIDGRSTCLSSPAGAMGNGVAKSSPAATAASPAANATGAARLDGDTASLRAQLLEKDVAIDRITTELGNKTREINKLTREIHKLKVSTLLFFFFYLNVSFC